MAIIRWNPLRDVTAWNSGLDLSNEFVEMQREMDRVFDRFMRSGGAVNETEVSTYLPPVNILEHEDKFVVTAELPGVRKEDVRITITNDVLTIRGEKKHEMGNEGKNFHRVERAAGMFQRSFTLPSLVRADRIEAAYNDGILTITVPKAEEAKPKQIEVNVK